METHYTKKASAYIMKAVLKENPKASKLTTFDEAFVLLMDKWGLEGSIETSKDNITKFSLYREDEVIKVYTWEGAWLEKEGDWNWNIIYKDVLEDVLKSKLYKKPKLGKRAQAKLEKEKAAKKALAVAEERKAKKAEEELNKKKEAAEKEKEIKYEIQKLKMRIYNYKKKNKDYSELESQVNELNNTLKLAKTV